MAGTTVPPIVDMQTLVGTSGLGVEVVIFCPTQDVLFCGSDESSTALVITATAPSASALIADRAPAGLGKVRTLVHRYLVVRLASGSDLITIKPV